MLIFRGASIKSYQSVDIHIYVALISTQVARVNSPIVLKDLIPEMEGQPINN